MCDSRASCTEYCIRNTAYSPRERGAPASHTKYGIQNTKYIPRELRSGGMTMIDVIVWVSVLLMVLLAITSSLLYFYRVNRYAIQQSSAVTSAQRGMENAIRTIREASYSSEGAFPIVSIGPNDFVFYADIDSDSLIEKVHHYVSGNSFLYGTTDPTGDPPVYTDPETVSTIADYVHNTDENVKAFRYYDASGLEITDYAQWAKVRFVQVSLVVNVDPNKLPNQLVLSSSAAIRNLK